VTDEMRVLTVWQPWARAIIHVGRTLRTGGGTSRDYRWPAAIHAGLLELFHALTNSRPVLAHAFHGRGGGAPGPAIIGPGAHRSDGRRAV